MKSGQTQNHPTSVLNDVWTVQVSRAVRRKRPNFGQRCISLRVGEVSLSFHISQAVVGGRRFFNHLFSPCAAVREMLKLRQP